MESEAQREPERSTPNTQYVEALELYKYIIEKSDIMSAELGSQDSLRPRIDDELIQAAIQEELNASQQYHDSLILEKTEVSQGFNWEQEAKRGLRDAINLLYKRKLIDERLLRDASKFAGPSSVVIDEQTEESATLDLEGYAIFLQICEAIKTGTKIKKIDQIHVREELNKQRRDVRNALTRLTVKPSAIKEHASFLKFGHGLNLSNDDAARAVLIEFTGHEYAHALHHAMSLDGIDLTEKGLSLIADDGLRQLVREKGNVEERFTIGLQLVVLSEALRTMFGVSEAKIAEIANRYKESTNRVTRNYFEIKSKLGQTPYTIDSLSALLQPRIQAQLPPNTELITLRNQTKYGTGYFSEDQVRSMLTRDQPQQPQAQ